MNKINILWAGKTGDANAWYHIFPIIKSDLVERIDVVRNNKPSRIIPEVNYITFDRKNKITEFFCFIFQLIKSISFFKYDLVISFNPYPWGIITFIICKFFKKKFIMGLIGGEIEKQRNSQIKIMILMFVLRNSSAITVTGNRMKRNLKLLGIDKKKIFIFPHLVDINYLMSAKSKQKGIPKFDIITISSFLKVKRTSDAIRILAKLHKNKHPLTLCILGEGKLKAECKQLTKDLNLDKFVFFCGYQNDIRPFLYGADYYLQTSKSEGLSIALIEAMAAGLIPIVTNAGDEKDVIINGVTGFVVSINSPEKIAETIIEVEKSILKQTMKNNLYKSRVDFDVNKSNKEIDKLLTFIINA